MLGLQGQLFKEFVSVRERSVVVEGSEAASATAGLYEAIAARDSPATLGGVAMAAAVGGTTGRVAGSMRGGTSIPALRSQARLKEHIHTLLTELPTMTEVLLLTPEWLGLNIEIKYPVEALHYGV